MPLIKRQHHLLQVYAHLLDPFQDNARGQDRVSRLASTVATLEREVEEAGGWDAMLSVKVQERNADAEVEDLEARRQGQAVV